MSNNLRPCEGAKVIRGFAPVGCGSEAVAEYISVKNAEHTSVICTVNQDCTAGPIFNLYQSSDDGTNSARLTTVVNIWANVDCSASDTFIKTTSAADYTCGTTSKDKIIIFDVPSSALTDASAYLGVTMPAGDGSNHASVNYLQTGLRYSQATPPSALGRLLA